MPFTPKEHPWINVGVLLMGPVDQLLALFAIKELCIVGTKDFMCLNFRYIKFILFSLFIFLLRKMEKFTEIVTFCSQSKLQMD